MSEGYFGGDLEEARRGGADHLAKIRAANVPLHGLGTIKLRVIEYIETFEADFQGFRLCEFQIFLHGQIEIVDSRAGEEPAAAVTYVLAIVSPRAGSSAGMLKSEVLKYGVSIARIVIQIKRTGSVS